MARGNQAVSTSSKRRQFALDRDDFGLIQSKIMTAI
jgi:hypothetical protein